LIDGGNIGIELSQYWQYWHFLLGFCEIRVQGSEVSFQVLATGWAMMTREHEKGRVGPQIKWVMGEVYHNDQGDEWNPMG
jgi:hypothetical protein